MPAPRKLSDEGHQETIDTALNRDRLLTDKQLAMKYRVSVACIHRVMAEARRRLNLTKLLGSKDVPRGTTGVG